MKKKDKKVKKERKKVLKAKLPNRYNTSARELGVEVKRLGLHKKDIAKALGVSVSTLNKWLRGVHRPGGVSRVLLHLFLKDAGVRTTLLNMPD